MSWTAGPSAALPSTAYPSTALPLDCAGAAQGTFHVCTGSLAFMPST